ncbi:MAG: hypothetical protein JRG89_13025 [Deltaproteobacteria bacterium]|nr:hypothetical protein [Deltaproteobacteria bacterium]
MKETSFIYYYIRLALALASISVASVPGFARAELNPAVDEVLEQPAPSQDSQPERRRFYSSMGLGSDFSRGDYGSSEQTNSLSIPAALKLEWEPIALRVSIPFLLINGSDSVLAATDGPTSNGGSVLGESYRYGPGDVSTSLTYTYYPTQQWVPLVDLRVKVKIPTADSDLGTQKTDTTLQFDLTERFGPLSVFGGFGYRFKGGASYDDILLGSVGFSYRVMSTLSAALAFDWRESSIKGVPDAKELSPSLSIRVNDHARFGPYGVVGFSDSSPDWGIGAMSTWNF